MKLEQVWHQVKNTSVGLGLMEQMSQKHLNLNHQGLELTHSQGPGASVVLAG